MFSSPVELWHETRRALLSLQLYCLESKGIDGSRNIAILQLPAVVDIFQVPKFVASYALLAVFYAFAYFCSALPAAVTLCYRQYFRKLNNSSTVGRCPVAHEDSYHRLIHALETRPWGLSSKRLPNAVPLTISLDRVLSSGRSLLSLFYLLQRVANAGPFDTGFLEHDVVHDETSNRIRINIGNHAEHFRSSHARFVQNGTELDIGSDGCGDCIRSSRRFAVQKKKRRGRLDAYPMRGISRVSMSISLMVAKR